MHFLMKATVKGRIVDFARISRGFHEAIVANILPKESDSIIQVIIIKTVTNSVILSLHDSQDIFIN